MISSENIVYNLRLVDFAIFGGTTIILIGSFKKIVAVGLESFILWHIQERAIL